MAEYIDREKLLEEINNDVGAVASGDKEREWLIELIKRQDTNDVAPVKHSEWVIYEDDDFDYEEPIKVTEETLWQEEHKHPCHTTPQCKECHYHALLNGGEEYVLSDYCPKCGAKMDGE